MPSNLVFTGSAGILAGFRGNCRQRCRRSQWAHRLRFAAVLAALSAFSGCNRQMVDGGDGWKVSAGDSLPAFNLVDLNGKETTSADFAGKTVYLSVFATWCPPCRAELVALEKNAWPSFKDQGIAIVAVSSGEDSATVRQFVQRERLTFPVLVDESNTFTSALGGNFLPRSLLVNSDGKIVSLHAGFEEAALPELIEEIKSVAK